MEGVLVEKADYYEVDPLLLTAIMFHESRYCGAYADWHNEQYKNCSGIMDGGQANGLVSYDSYEDFLDDFAKLIGYYIYDYGRDTIEAIGSKYAPVDSHEINAYWNGGVTAKYQQLWSKLK